MDGHNVLSRVFNLSHIRHMTLDDRKRFLDPENLCLDTSPTTLGVEILYFIEIDPFSTYFNKKSSKYG